MDEDEDEGRLSHGALGQIKAEFLRRHSAISSSRVAVLKDFLQESGNPSSKPLEMNHDCAHLQSLPDASLPPQAPAFPVIRAPRRMKTSLHAFFYLLIAACFSASGITVADEDVSDGQPKLLRISATVDGSGRIIFTRGSVRYEHKHWDLPTDMMFDGVPWTDLEQTPAAWREIANQLDPTKAWIVKREGRDMIALESTPDGFDLYLCDSPSGASEYTVTIAIPRRH
jgi:hypothetical protein